MRLCGSKKGWSSSLQCVPYFSHPRDQTIKTVLYSYTWSNACALMTRRYDNDWHGGFGFGGMIPGVSPLLLRKYVNWEIQCYYNDLVVFRKNY